MSTYARTDPHVSAQSLCHAMTEKKIGAKHVWGNARFLTEMGIDLLQPEPQVDRKGHSVLDRPFIAILFVVLGVSGVLCVGVHIHRPRCRLGPRNLRSVNSS